MNMSQLATNACTSCKQRKRKCDKVVPTCGTCSRVGRSCLYEDLGSSTSQLTRSNDGAMEGTSRGIIFDATHQVDPFCYETLRQPTVDVAVSNEALKVLGSIENIQEAVSRYSITAFTRLPILSISRINARIPSIYEAPRADFITLCMCINLVAETPDQEGHSMQSSVYVMIKGIISLLEATNVVSLDFVQARLLISSYEMGHGIHPAACISIGSCARTARSLGLNKKRFQVPTTDADAKRISEEEKRVWWGVHNLDRFINLCNGDAMFGTEDPQSDDLLPTDDKLWVQDIIPTTKTMTLASPSDITVGSFARECQISHLVGRVLRHVYDPTSDPAFHAEESLQLERTLVAFLPLLIAEEQKYGLYCAAMGLCSSALFTLYDSRILSGQYNQTEQTRVLGSIAATSQRIVDFSGRLFGVVEEVNFERLSPFVPHSLYQSAVVQFRLLKQTNETKCRENLDSLKKILGYFNRRWIIAGRYLEALNTFKCDWPVTIFPLEGFSVSAKGPTGENAR